MDGGIETGFETCMTGNLDRRRGEPDDDHQALGCLVRARRQRGRIEA